MRDPIYTESLVVRSLAELGDGDLVIIGTQAGPAGSSLVEFPDGAQWEVDHADPALLVQLLSNSEAGRSGLVADLIGEKRAAHARSLAAVAAAADDGRGHRLPGLPTGSPWPSNSRDLHLQWQRHSRSGRDGFDAARVGRLVLLVDLFGEHPFDPFLRVVAAAEFLLTLESEPDLELFDPLRPVVLSTVGPAAADVENDALVPMAQADPDALQRAANALRGLAHRAPALRLPLERLLGRIDNALADSRTRGWGAARFPSVQDAPSGWWGDGAAMNFDLADDLDTDMAEAPPDAADHRQVERVEAGMLRVTVTRSDRDRWVRVLRTEGLVLLAAAPLLADGIMEVAELAVPPDATTDSLVVEVVDPSVLTGTPRPAELVRDAVLRGRDAARADRLGRHDSARRWEECARAWTRAGDDRRAALARAYGHDGASQQEMPFLCDELVEALNES